MPQIIFTPERVLDSDSNLPVIAVKGQIPHFAYPFQLRDIYPTVPALGPLPAYQKIVQQFEHINTLLCDKLHLRESLKLPSVANDQDALAILGVLFDPTCYSTSNIWVSLAASSLQSSRFIEISNALPFPFEIASDKKLLHTLAWIDTNVKVIVEQVANRYLLPEQVAVQIVQSAFYIYSLLIKQQNYRLARHINFNYSMFFQDRILNLLFGDRLFSQDQSSVKSRHISNQIAVDLLRDLSDLSFRQLCLASLFMGIIWTNATELQKSYSQNPNNVLGDVHAKLFSSSNQLAIDHIDIFFKEISTSRKVVVILDDNGESVFDLAIYQKLLSEFHDLKVIFVVNRFPVSNNISEAPFKLLLRDSCFRDLDSYLVSHRADVVYEQQVFRSFERSFISPETLNHIDRADFVYIKGANFFETMQFPASVVYHAFIVHGEMSKVLTGFPEGLGIFARIPRQKSAYIYQNAEHVITLKDQLSLWSKE